ncbi:unnamed protein product [Ixodes pacificus]
MLSVLLQQRLCPRQQTRRLCSGHGVSGPTFQVVQGLSKSIAKSEGGENGGKARGGDGQPEGYAAPDELRRCDGGVFTVTMLSATGEHRSWLDCAPVRC